MAAIAHADKASSSAKALRLCGILAPLLFLGTDILAGTRWESYSFVTQSVSELSAPGVPTRPLAVPLIIAYYVLIAAFGLGVWGSAGQSRALRITARLIVGNGILGLAAVFFPMHPGEPAGALPNILNTVILGLSTLSTAGSAGTRSGRCSSSFCWRLWGYGSRRVLARAVRASAQERTMVYGCLLWVVLLAIFLLQSGHTTITSQRTSG